jgi:hypothetical protein
MLLASIEGEVPPLKQTNRNLFNLKFHVVIGAMLIKYKD